METFLTEAGPVTSGFSCESDEAVHSWPVLAH